MSAKGPMYITTEKKNNIKKLKTPRTTQFRHLSGKPCSSDSKKNGAVLVPDGIFPDKSMLAFLAFLSSSLSIWKKTAPQYHNVIALIIRTVSKIFHIQGKDVGLIFNSVDTDHSL